MTESANTSSTSAPIVPVVRREDDRTQQPRHRSARTGGPKLKLQVFGDIPGYHLYWCNDEDAAIEQLLEEGFEFVTPDEVRMKSALVADKDLDNRLSRYVGTKRDGSAMRAYLMKCTNDLWEQFQADTQAQADHWDGAIHRSHEAPGENRYKPAGYDTFIHSGTKSGVSR
jgi:hypothetical protein